MDVQRLKELLTAVARKETTIDEALRRLDTAGVALHDVALRRPTLDDVFLTLTGHGAEATAFEEEVA